MDGLALGLRSQFGEAGSPSHFIKSIFFFKKNMSIQQDLHDWSP
jgi:hypothetical protein